MFYIALALIPYVVFVLANRFAGQRLESSLVIAIINTISAIVPIVLVMLKFGRPSAEHIGNNMAPYIAAVIGGLGIGVYSLFLTKAFSTTNVAIVLPLVQGGIIVLGSLSAYIVFREKVSPLQFAGLVLVVLGMSLVVLSKMRG